MFKFSISNNGYLPDFPKKAFIINYTGKNKELEFSVNCIETRYKPHPDWHDKNRENSRVYCAFKSGTKPAFDEISGKTVLVMDFTSINECGLYQIECCGKYSEPFFIRKDAYSRYAYETFYYSRIQRCGDSLNGWHDKCHMDDIFPYGWHDAGDLRKWCDHTQWQAFGMLLARENCLLNETTPWHNYKASDKAFLKSENNEDDILCELRFGNLYFHAIYDDTTGYLRGDVGGEEADNHWTDNIKDSADERSNANVFNSSAQSKFALIQAMCYSQFSENDYDYAIKCKNFAEKELGHLYACLKDIKEINTLTLCQMLSSNIYLNCSDKITTLLAELLSRQDISGYFYDTDNDIFCDWWQMYMLAFSLCKAYEYDSSIKNNILKYADWLLKFTSKSVFAAYPAYFTRNPATHDFYHSDNDIYYRYFLPCTNSKAEKKRFIDFGQGTNTVILGCAASLLTIAKLNLTEDSIRLKFKAVELMQYVHGQNPLGVCFVTGRSSKTPYPHSRYLGLINGAVMNGISGDENDKPYIGNGMEDDYNDNYLYSWQTLEYWGPSQSQLLICMALLDNIFKDYSSGIGYIGYYTNHQ